MTVEIVLLAMIALFVGLRLYAVLGQRTGHEQRPLVTRPDAAPDAAPAPAAPDAAPGPAEPSGYAYEQGASAGIRAIIADAAIEGGFPPLRLDPIDFTGLYLQSAAQAAAEASGGQAGDVTGTA